MRKSTGSPKRSERFLRLSDSPGSVSSACAGRFFPLGFESSIPKRLARASSCCTDLKKKKEQVRACVDDVKNRVLVHWQTFEEVE